MSGRWGHQAFSVPVAGAMDPFAHRLANALVGNPRPAATLEVTIAGPTLQFVDDRIVAVTGATFELRLDDEPVSMDVPMSVRAGSLLTFGSRVRGARAYVAISGGVDTVPVLGSRATHLPTSTGGVDGRALRRGDRLPLGHHSPSSAFRPPTSDLQPLSSALRPPCVRLLPGPHDDRFMTEALEALVSAPYHVDVHSDRMGFRLTGPALRHRGSPDILSEPSPLGSLQVPASEQPLLLMADRPTTGGYTKLATVITADIGVVAQLCPGDRLQFQILFDGGCLCRAACRGAPSARHRIGDLVTDFARRLIETFGEERVTCNAPLRDYTTFRVGGPADLLLETRSSDDLVQALRLASEAGVPVVMLGGGSNVLVSDAGVRGLVIRARGGVVQRVDAGHVRADAAVTINGLVRWTITHGVAGVEEWAGTPGTVGGAVYGNAHFGGRLISELITSVRLCSRSGELSEVPTADMGFGYDRSRLQTTGRSCCRRTSR
ncbi:MAG: 5-oxoprolinase/urea amidolyase family protein [Vicinamibacterales bacterium]